MSIKPFLAAALGLAYLTSPSRADDSETNKTDVQKNLKQDWDNVVFGKEFDHAEYLKAVTAIAASVATENPAILTAYAKDLAKSSLDALSTELKTELVIMALKNPTQTFRVGDLEISGGFATYEHKKVAVIDIPDGVEVKDGRVTVRTRRERVVVNLPNTYQPYVRVRVKK